MSVPFGPLSSPLANDLLNILETSRILKQKLPTIRQYALTETLRASKDDATASDIFFENLSTSPYIPDDQKSVIANYMLAKRWQELRNILQCTNASIFHTSSRPTFHNTWTFRRMVLTIFRMSRKVMTITGTRRRELGAAILTQTSIDDLKHVAYTALQTSEAFDPTARQQIANDIIDNRYDRLLLVDRFDCEEVPRKEWSDLQTNNTNTQNSDDSNECPICLGETAANSTLPCEHMFCRGCIDAWIRRSPRTNTHSCPMCRQSFTATQITDSRIHRPIVSADTSSR